MKKNYILNNTLYLNIDTNIIKNSSDINKISLHKKYIEEDYNNVIVSITYYNLNNKKELIKVFKFKRNDFFNLEKFKGKTDKYIRLKIDINKKEDLKNIL